MGLMDWANRNQKIAIPLALVALIAAVVIVMMNSGRRGGASHKSYYYELNSGQIVVADASEGSPIAAAGGTGEAVMARVFACGDCADASSRFVGWVVRYDADANAAAREQFSSPQAQNDPAFAGRVDAGTEIAFEPKGAEVTWVKLASAGVADRQRAMLTRCESQNKPTRSCLP